MKRVKDFVEMVKCQKTVTFRHLEEEDRSNLAVYEVLQNMCLTIKSLVGTAGYVTADAFEKMQTMSNARLEAAMDTFDVSWTSGSERELQRKKEQIRAYYARYVAWFREFIMNTKILEADVNVSYPVVWEDTSVLLTQKVNLILEREGSVIAYILNSGRNYEGRSLNGRSKSTQIAADLRYCVAKCSLEERYPGICLCVTFFKEGEQKGAILPWNTKGTKASNLFFLPYADYSKDSFFDKELLISDALTGLRELACVRQTVKCDSCIYKSDCFMQTRAESRPAERLSKEWKVPTFDAQQSDYVNFGEGQLLVLAGPGAGKTSSTIGRVIALAGAGIPTERMLLVTYTEKAAGEIAERLAGKYPEDEMPRIGTLHSVASDIIRLAAKVDQNRKIPNVETSSATKKLIKEILDRGPDLDGLYCRSYTKGRKSKVAMVYAGLKRLEDPKEAENFFAKHPEYVPQQWYGFREQVKELRRKKNYITFDEQIMVAAQILREMPEIRKYYKAMYSYIMVDEYQDINGQQEELIMLLAGEEGNLVCIGDDDQAIYGFKGCSAKYMQQFLKRHPKASVKSLGKNYRSTRKIVEFNNSILMDIDEEDRIAKVVEYTDYAEEGKAPVLINGNTVEEVEAVIQQALLEGYSYEDIAVIATTNDALGVLHDSLRIPTELASAYVINDYMFHVVKNTLEIVLGKAENGNAFFRLGYLLNKDAEWYRAWRENALPETDEVLELLSYAQKQKSDTAEHYVARLCAYLDMDESSSEQALLSMVRGGNITFLHDLYETISDMVTFGDEKKLEYAIKGRVTLITAHSCKGKEWDVVIVYDGNAYDCGVSSKTKDSMDIKLSYVSTTRARKRLYLMKAKNSHTLYDNNALVIKKETILPVAEAM